MWVKHTLESRMLNIISRFRILYFGFWGFLEDVNTILVYWVQGMSQYFVKVLNTQYQYFSKILLNTQYFNTFFHLKCIENTNTNINTQYFQFKWCTNTTMIFIYFHILSHIFILWNLPKTYSNAIITAFSKFSSFKLPRLKVRTNLPLLNLKKHKMKSIGIGQSKMNVFNTNTLIWQKFQKYWKYQ